jgi:hypothetical protein
MRKLKLESLQVESFDTTSIAAPEHGTVQANADSGQTVCYCPFTRGRECKTYDYQNCPDTEYMDCTLVCSNVETCQVGC